MSAFTAKMRQTVCRLGFAPDPTGGAYSTPPDPQLDSVGLLLREGKEGKRRGGERRGIEPRLLWGIEAPVSQCGS